MDLIKIAEEAFATGKQHPSFKAGDTVTVAYRIIEGNKNVYSCTVVLLSKSPVTETRNVLLYVKCQVL